MSQSSGLLGEEELRVNLNEFLNTNLERDALLKPTKEILIDIYSKFLDSTGRKWKGDEFPIEVYIVPHMNRLIIPQDPPYKFLITDILAPVKKKTNYFLNFIVYMHAHHSEYLRLESNYLQERAGNQAKSENLKANIENERQKLEDFALKRSALPSKEEIVERIEAGRKKLMDVEKLGEELKEEGKSIKEKVKNDRERLLIVKKKKEVLIKQKCIIDNARSLSDKIPELEDQLRRSKLDHEQLMIDKKRRHDTELNSLEVEYEAKLAKSRSEQNALSDVLLYENELVKEKLLKEKQLLELDNEIRFIEEEAVKEKVYLTDLMKSSAIYIDRLREESSRMDKEILPRLSFLKPKLEETLDAPADRTYIKK